MKSEIKSKHYRKSRLKNFLRNGLIKIFQMGSMVIIGEYMLLYVINMSLSEQNPVLHYKNMPSQFIDLAVSERPFLRMAEAYSTIQKTVDFDQITQLQYPVHIKGSSPEFRTSELQDKEGAKVGYVVKF